MNKLLPIVFFLAFVSSSLWAQNQANIWYFGHNAGLDFNSSPPTPLIDGDLNTDEGCASISDTDGNLLFYTDGSSVWNRNHVVMPDGTGLLGHKSSTQSGVIVPKPGANDIYYVFTVDFTAGPGGISYSEVDMTLEGGLGNVTTLKNEQLITSACEKITAVLHKNGEDFWVIGHAFDTGDYMSWRVTPDGVNPSAIVSSVGVFIGGNSFNSIGYMKASAEGDKIAAAHWWNVNTVEVFDFDNETGILSNPIILNGFSNMGGAYGVEFAPCEPILYVSERSNGGSLYQFDLSSNNQTTISNSRITLATYSNRWGAIQLGPDGKMYVAKQQNLTLGLINNPNTVGFGCNYEDDAVDLAGKTSWIGLPSFIQSYFILSDFLVDGFCPTNPTFFSSDIADCSIDSLIWDFGDPASGADNFSTDLMTSHTYLNEGTYNVTLTVYTPAQTLSTSQEVTLAFPDFDLGSDISSCANAMNTIDATTPGATYLWSDGSTNPTLATNQAGNIWVEVSVDGCPSRDTISIINLPSPDLDIQDDPAICENETFTFNATTPNVSSYIWQNNSTSPTLTAGIAGNYSVTATGTNGCTAEDQSYLTIKPLPVFSLGADDWICENENLLLNVNVGNNSTYLWQDGSTDPTFNVTQAGTYTVEVTTDGCTSEDEIVLNYLNIPTVFLGNDTLICPNEELVLDAYFDEFTTYMWQNNSNLPTFTLNEPGTYSVQLQNDCGTAFDEIIVGENTSPEPLFIGNDTTLCIGESYLLDATNQNTTHYLWQDGTNESSILVEESGFYAITWANNCGFVTESIEVVTRKCECPVIFPNIFSPNGDGNNEKFNTVSPCTFFDYNLKIYSRWGELVFETNNPTYEAGWNGTFKGKDVQEGVFIYMVEYAHEFDAGRVSGDITVIR